MSQNRLFVANKPEDIGCNFFLKQIKRKYSIKKAGFSGTLDPFASGCLIIAFGQYTKLFRFLKKAPKTYKATLYLGARSESLDIEKLENIEEVEEVAFEKLEEIAKKLTTTLTYLPPKYSAKKVDGKRAYELARKGEEFELKKITTQVFYLHVKTYSHPFVEFEISVSEGGYIRSIGKMFADELGVEGCLKSLHRVNEGSFFFDDEKALNPLEYLDLRENFYLGDKEDILLGRVLSVESFECTENGEYFLVIDNLLSVIKIEENAVIYHINRMELC
ncbi:MAG: tRNA pseudouridine(55) synthase TruB [Campylobacteraceae bacterium]